MPTFLPEELLLEIFQCLPVHQIPMHGGYESLYKHLLLVDRRFYRLVQPFMWRSVRLLGVNTFRSQSLELCARINSDPGLASAVQTLELRSWDFGPDAIYEARAGQNFTVAHSDAHSNSRSHDRSIVYDAVKSMTNLVSLQISSCSFSSPFDRIIRELPRLSSLVLAEASIHFFRLEVIGPCENLHSFTIAGGSEDQSYLQFCTETATSPKLSELEISGEIVPLLLSSMQHVRLPSLRSLTIRNVSPNNMQDLYDIHAAHPLLEKVSLLECREGSSMTIDTEARPWNLLKTLELSHLMEFCGPPSLVPLFILGRPVRRVSMEVAGFQSEYFTTAAKALSKLPSPLRRVFITNIISRELNQETLVSALVDLPLTEELHVRLGWAALFGEESLASKIKFTLIAVSSSLTRFLGLRLIAVEILPSPGAPMHIGYLPHQYEIVHKWCEACPSLIEIQLARYVRWIRAGNDWLPIFNEETPFRLTGYFRARYELMVNVAFPIVDWNDSLYNYMCREGVGKEARRLLLSQDGHE